MALCTVDYVRSKVTTKLTDSELQDIIDETGNDVLDLCGTTDETNPIIILAGKNAILADVYRKMKTTGELAASVSTGNAQRQNTTDKDIDFYQIKAESYISQYKSASSYSFSSPAFHVGFGSHHGGHHGHN